MAKLDKLIVIDPNNERAEFAAHVVGEFADQTVVIDYSLGEDSDPNCIDSPEVLSKEIERVQEAFRNEVSATLKDKKVLMVIFNIHACVKAELLMILRELEEEYGFGSRKILYTCKSRSAVTRGFRRRGISRKGVRHIQERKDPKIDLEALRALMT